MNRKITLVLIMTLFGMSEGLRSQECEDISEFPWSYGFEGAATGSYNSSAFGAPCWTHINPSTYYAGYPVISSGSSYIHTGSRGLYWYCGSGANYGSYQIIVLPGVDTDVQPVNTLQLSFWGKSMGTYVKSPELTVGVMTDPGDVNTFVAVGDPIRLDMTEWQEYEVLLGSYTGTGKYVAVRADKPSSGLWTAAVDDFTLSVAPPCPAVSKLRVTSATENEVAVAWTPRGSESSWEVRLDGEVKGIVATPSYTFTGLTERSTHTASVVAKCSGDETSDPVDLEVSTTAPVVREYPFRCTFEDASLNSHWMTRNEEPNGWTIGTATSYANSGGTHSLYITNGSGNNYTASSGCLSYAYVLLEMEAKEYTLSYSWKCYGNTSDYLRVAYAPVGTELPEGYSSWGASTAMPAGFSWLDGGTRRYNLSSWSTYSYTFTPPAAGTYMLVFVWRNSSSSSNQPPAAVDNVQVFDCPMPQSFSCSAVTATTASLSWTGTAGSYQVDYGPNGSGSSRTTTSNEITLTDLSPGTSYRATVRSLCEGGKESPLFATTFTTTPEPITTLPWSCDFEGTEAGDWALVGTSGNRWVIGTGANNTTGGSKALYVSNDGNTNNYAYNYYSNNSAYAVFTLEEGQYVIDYDWRSNGGSTSAYLRVALAPASFNVTVSSNGWGYSTTPGIALDGGSSLFGQTSWQHRRTVFEVPSSGDYKLVFYWFNNNSSAQQPPAAVDNIVLRRDLCPFVSVVTVTDRTTSSATLSWTGTDGSYRVEYGPTGFALGTGTVRTVETTSINLTGLSELTEYDVYIQKVCGTDILSLPIMKSFITAMNPISTFPWSCDFEGSCANGWEFKNANYTNQWCIGTGTYNTGGKSIYVTNGNGAYYDYNASQTANIYASIPFHFDEGLYRISFDWKSYGDYSSWNGYNDYMVVYIIPEDNWNLSNPVAGEGRIRVGNVFYYQYSWTTGTYDVAVPSSGNYRLLFNWYNDNSSGYNPAAVDNVVVEQLCPNPTDITNTALTTNSATFSWTGSTSSYYIEYGPAGTPYADMQHLTVEGNSHTFSGLTRNTSYTFAIRGICAPGDTSSRIETTFTTAPMEPLSLPFSCDFEDDAHANQWALTNGSYDNQWYIGSAVNNTMGGSKALYVSNDEGASHAYTNNQPSSVWALSLLNIEQAGTYYVSFDWMANGTSDDWMSAALIPASQNLAEAVWNRETPPGIALNGGAPMYVKSSWQHKEMDIEVPSAGLYNLVFYWINGNNNYTDVQPPAAVDNVVVRRQTCLPPTGLTAAPVSSTSHTVSWTGTAGQYIVEYGTTATISGTYGVIGYYYNYNNPGEKTSLTVSGTSVTLTGLQAGVEYEVIVRSSCDDVVSLPSTITFITLPREPETVLPFEFKNSNSVLSFLGGYWYTSGNTRTFRKSSYYGSYSCFNPYNGGYYTQENSYSVFHSVKYDLAAYNSYNIYYSSCNDDYHAPCSPYSSSATLQFYSSALLRLEPGSYTLSQDYWCSVGALRIGLIPASLDPLSTWISGWNSSALSGVRIPLDGDQALPSTTEWTPYSTTFTVTEAGFYYLAYNWASPYSESTGPVGINNIVLDYVPGPDVHHVSINKKGEGNVALTGSGLVAGGNYVNGNSVITITATPEADQGLQYLFVNGQQVTSPHTLTVTSDLEISVSFIPLDRADLHVVDLVVPDDLQLGQTVEISFTVRNDGFVATTGSWTDYLWLDQDITSSADQGKYLGSWTRVKNLEPGESYTRIVTVTLPLPSEFATGQAWLWATSKMSFSSSGYPHVPQCPDGASFSENGNPPYCTTSSSTQTPFPEPFEDYGIVYSHSYATDNFLVKPVQISLPPMPELHIASLSHTALSAGYSCNVTFSVRNDGDGPTDNVTWTDRLYLSSTPEIPRSGGDYTLLGSWNNVKPLDVGETYTRQVSVTIPSSYGSDDDDENLYYFILTTDAVNVYDIRCPQEATAQDNNAEPYCTAKSYVNTLTSSSARDKIDELSEVGTFVNLDNWGKEYRHDNFLVNPVHITITPTPQLHALSLTSSDIIVGHEANFSWTIRNEGPVSTPVGATWNDYLYLSSEPDWKEGGLLGSWPNLSALEPGQEYTRSVTVDIPQRITTGSMYLSVVTNPDGNPALWGRERLDSVVTIPVEVTMPPLADLQVVSIVPPTDFYSGTRVTVTAQITNAGVAPTTSNGWTDNLYISQSPTFDETTAFLVATSRHNASASNPLVANGTYTAHFSGKVPLRVYGDVYFYVTTNADLGEFENLNGYNNTLRSNAVHVYLTPPADLVVSTVNVPENASNRSQLKVKYSVKNQGNGKPDTLFWLDRIYLASAQLENGVLQGDLRDNSGRICHEVIVDFDWNDNPVYDYQCEAYDGTGEWYYPLGAALNADSLLPSHSYTQTLNYDMPDWLPTGDYYIVVAADGFNDAFEYDKENNNLKAAAFHYTYYRHDFSPADLQIPSPVVQDYAVKCSFDVKNTGGLDFTGQLDIDIYVSDSPQLTFGSNGQALNATKLQSLNPQVTILSPLSTTSSLPTSTGTSSTIAVIGSSGSTSGSSGSSESVGAIGSTYNPLPSASQSVVTSNSSHYSPFITFPSSLPDGDYYLHVVANPYHHFGEVNFTDNTAATSVRLCHDCPMPDIAPENLVLPSSVTSGTTAQIEFDLRNNGTVDLNGDYLLTALHLSSDGGETWTWCPVSSQTFPSPIAQPTTVAGGTTHYIQRVTIPPSLPAGSYSVRLSLDVSEALQEANEDDNIYPPHCQSLSAHHHGFSVDRGGRDWECRLRTRPPGVLRLLECQPFQQPYGLHLHP